MTINDLNNLKVGDMCIFTRHNKGRICEVVFIEGEYICVRSVDGKPFKNTSKSAAKFISVENFRYLKTTK